MGRVEMTDTLTELKVIRDELSKNKQLPTANNLDNAMYLCDIAEHITMATHHLNFAISRLVAYQCFEKQDE